jgi:hypothetical protein
MRPTVRRTAETVGQGSELRPASTARAAPVLRVPLRRVGEVGLPCLAESDGETLAQLAILAIQPGNLLVRAPQARLQGGDRRALGGRARREHDRCSAPLLTDLLQ